VAADERDRPDGVRRRAQWTKYQNKIAPERLVFIDETRTKANMAPIRGRAPLGIGLKAKVPHGRCRGRLRHDRTIAQLFRPGECANYFKNAGLRPNLNASRFSLKSSGHDAASWSRRSTSACGMRQRRPGRIAKGARRNAGLGARHRRPALQIAEFRREFAFRRWRRTARPQKSRR
jgi:hypothetical protein